MVLPNRRKIAVGSYDGWALAKNMSMLLRQKIGLISRGFSRYHIRRMIDLNDARIREALLRRLARQKARPRAVLEELHVHNGNAIADVVTLHSEAHCYEIKGATDRVERIVAQGAYYNTAFRRITLVTTECKLQRAMDLAPLFWGIMVAVEDTDTIRFRHFRAAQLNPHFERQSAAMTLDRVPEFGPERVRGWVR